VQTHSEIGYKRVRKLMADDQANGLDYICADSNNPINFRTW